MTNGRGWSGAGVVAVVGLTIAVTGVGCPGCPPETKVGPGTDTTGGTTTTPAPANPLVFTASDGSPADCNYTYDTGAPGAPTFTLNYGGKGITVKATYSGGSTSLYDPPPPTMQITYGDASPFDFDTGQLTLVPTAGPGITVKENSPSSWTMTTVGSKSGIALNWGKKWNIKFSCGATANCCANTPRIDVTADGTF